MVSSFSCYLWGPLQLYFNRDLQSILFLLMRLRLMWPQQLQWRSSVKDWGAFREQCFLCVGWVGGAHLWRTGWRSRSLCVWSAPLRRRYRRRAAGSWPLAPWRKSRSCSSPPDCCSSAKILNVYKKKRSPQGGYTSHTCWQLQLSFSFLLTKKIIKKSNPGPWTSLFSPPSLSLSLFCTFSLVIFSVMRKRKRRVPSRSGSPIYGRRGAPVGGCARWHQRQIPAKHKHTAVM